MIVLKTSDDENIFRFGLFGSQWKTRNKEWKIEVEEKKRTNEDRTLKTHTHRYQPTQTAKLWAHTGISDWRTGGMVKFLKNANTDNDDERDQHHHHITIQSIFIIIISIWFFFWLCILLLLFSILVFCVYFVKSSVTNRFKAYVILLSRLLPFFVGIMWVCLSVFVCKPVHS